MIILWKIERRTPMFSLVIGGVASLGARTIGVMFGFAVMMFLDIALG